MRSFLTSITVLLCLGWCAIALSVGELPTMMSFQGRLTATGGVPATGIHRFDFSI